MDQNNNFHELMGRVAGFAIVDIVGTLIGTEIVVVLLKKFFSQSVISSFSRTTYYILAFVLGVVVHEFFNVETPFNKLLA